MFLSRDERNKVTTNKKPENAKIQCYMLFFLSAEKYFHFLFENVLYNQKYFLDLHTQ